MALAVPAAILLTLAAVFYQFAAVHIVTAAEAPFVAGDRLLIERRAYRGYPLRRGELLAIQAGSVAALGRVLALPDETIAIRPDAVLLDGKAVPRWRIADQVAPACARPASDPACHRPRLRAAFPDGRSLDLPAALDVPKRTVAPGHLLILASDGPHLVAASAVVGRASTVLLSLRGGARWREPATWRHAVRWERGGLRL